MSPRFRILAPSTTAGHNPAAGWGGACLAATAALASGEAAFGQVAAGSEVTNTAHIQYTLGDITVTLPPASAVFVIRRADTPPAIEFFRYSPNAPNPIRPAINGSDFSPTGGPDGPFTPVGAPVTTGGNVLDLSGDVPLIPATTYLADELMFLRVRDCSANADPLAIDTLVITVESDTGDTVTLRLYESAPDSCEFYAFLPSTLTRTPRNDNTITVAANTQLTATYLRSSDATSVVVDTATVNPLNRVFSSTSGEEVGGAVVTLRNVDTGETAVVFGVDGFSAFPAEVVSGTDVTDGAGLVYDNDGGEFRYPVLEPGTYVVDVDPPEGFTFASDRNAETILSAPGMGGFVLTPGSFGQEFKITETGPLRFDIPLDPLGELTVTKSVDRFQGDVGDYVNYSVEIDNIGSDIGVGSLHDILPVGFRYVPGTARIAGAISPDPEISGDGALLTFDVGDVEPGETIRLDYALRIGPGAVFGTAINEALMRAPDGQVISNTGRAGIEIREDLFRQRSTIIGRMTEQSCDGSDAWARPIERGIGVAGVRLYMETGAYTVSDADGLFHFEGVKEGTHVVQVDRETLPQGFELMACEENTRFAGSIDSQFVDVQGGGIWRTNFYLKRVGDVATVETRDSFNDRTQFEDFDLAWLDTQTPEPAIAYPSEGRTPSLGATHVGVVHRADQSVELRVNNREVPGYHRTAIDTSNVTGATISRFSGVSIVDGRNVLVAVVRNPDGTVARELRQDLHYVDTIARIVPLPDQSVLTADGRIAPEIAIRFEDEAGRPVRAGRVTRIEVEPPYRLNDARGDNIIREQSEDLIAPLSASRDLSIGADGILRVELEPTLRTGKVTINAVTDTGRIVPIYMNLAPEKRDWILVGLAEGSAALDRVRGNATGLVANGANPDSVPSEDITSDGRVAFFAKGMIKGEWLMTLSLDTDKRKSARGSVADGDFLSEIDPNAYYTLYGDRSYQEFEGQSRYPLYVKLEKAQAYALFGDYDTDITEGRLTSYSRRLSGLKGEYYGETVQVLGFAAETNQGFALDELAADGTSGIYRLNNSRILAQSEEIVVETRDRVRPDVVIKSRTLVRYLDYTLDYLTGELLFRLPVDATDADFNPNVIVARYETAEETERNVTFGGRVQAQFGENDRVQIGSTFIHEDGSRLQAGAEATQVGVDLQVQLTDTTHARVEYALTDTKDGGTADAKLAEVIHTSDGIALEAYIREQDGGFGLGQLTSNTTAVRRFGARASARLQEIDDAETGERTTRRVEADLYREENLSTGDNRNSGEVLVRQTGRKISGALGLRAVRDEFTDRDTRESLLAVGRVAYAINKHAATVQLSHEQPIGGADEVSAQPARTTLGVTKRVGERANVTLRHDRTDGEFAVANNTTIGVDYVPWRGGQLTVASDMVTNDSGRRLGATVGLDQQHQINDVWSVSAGLRDRTVLSSQEEFVQVAPDDALSPFERNEDFTSAYLGFGYNKGATIASVRGETRLSSTAETYIGSASVARSLSETLSLAGSARIADNRDRIEGDSSRADIRLGASWRPKDEGLVLFDRLDISHRNEAIGVVETKVVNNVAANTWINDRWQLTGNWGAKYNKTEINGQDFSNFTNLLGAETRYDVTRRIDLGLRGQVMMQSGTDALQYSYGPSVGISPAKNVWLSAGYNIDGFKDSDFEASEYSRKGPYITMRFKFDQHTARGLLQRISPSAAVPLRADTGPRMLSQPLPPLPAVPQATAALQTDAVSSDAVLSNNVITDISVIEAAPLPVPTPEPVVEGFTCWDGTIVTDRFTCPVQPEAAPAPMPVVSNFLCADGVTTVSDLSVCPAPRLNLNVCAKSAVAIFDVPAGTEFEPMARLGTFPQFGDSHGLTPAAFHDKLAAAYATDADDAAYLDHLFQSMGYAGGWSDARPDMFSDAVLPEGTRGVMGMGDAHTHAFKILPSAQRDREAFRVRAANGQVVHFMKSCGNYFYGCE